MNIRPLIVALTLALAALPIERDSDAPEGFFTGRTRHAFGEVRPLGFAFQPTIEPTISGRIRR